MFAVIKSGGKQHKVKVGEVFKVEKLNFGVGAIIEFNDVLLAQKADGQVVVGAPTVSGAKVVAEIVEQGRDKKVKIMKFRRRKHSMKQQGHRQYFTALKVTELLV